MREWGKNECLIHRTFIYVTVLCRNRRLFHCVFQSHLCVQTTVSLNFHTGGAHAGYVDTSDIPAPTKQV